MKKIIVASFQCESNSKAKLHPTKEDFEYFKGEKIFKKLAVKDIFEHSQGLINMSINKHDIITSLKKLGIKSTDTIIVHSSLKSFGYVEGGADAVIDALKVVTSEGTLVFPTLRTRNFYDAYNDWDVEKTPSDVGYLTERFRLSTNVFRSNQETHSVCAYGKDAEYITKNHGIGEKRIGVFGDTPFSKQSPWQKMYNMDAKVVMIGVSMKYNTFKHFVEYKLVNDIIDAIVDENIKKQAVSKVSRFKDTAKYYLDGETAFSPEGVWLWHDSNRTQEVFEKSRKLKKVICGNSTIICFSSKAFVDFQYDEIINNPEQWLRDSIAIDWINEYKNA